MAPARSSSEASDARDTRPWKPMSTVDKLGNIRYALHQALTDNRNFIQQDLLQPIE